MATMFVLPSRFRKTGMHLKLNAAEIKGLVLPPGKTEEIFWDTLARGLGLRVRARGQRTFFSIGSASVRRA